MDLDACIFMVVESGATQTRIVHFEAEWPDKVQFAACVRAQAYNVAGIRRYLWIQEYYVKHGRGAVMAATCGAKR